MVSINLIHIQSQFLSFSTHTNDIFLQKATLWVHYNERALNAFQISNQESFGNWALCRVDNFDNLWVLID